MSNLTQEHKESTNNMNMIKVDRQIFRISFKEKRQRKEYKQNHIKIYS